MAERLTHNPEISQKERDRLEILKRIQDMLGWSEEIPERQVPTGPMTFQEYKIRDSWFSSGLALTSLARDNELLSETTSKRYAEVLRKFTGKEFSARGQNKDDIDEMNQFLLQVIEDLEEQHGEV